MVLPETPPRASQARHEDLEYEVLSLLENEPLLSQREIAHRLGVSLGRINSGLRGMIAAGKLRRSARANEVTELGVARRALLAQGYLQRKQAQLQKLAGQIAAIQGGMDADRVKAGQ